MNLDNGILLGAKKKWTIKTRKRHRENKCILVSEGSQSEKGYIPYGMIS